MNRFTLLEVLDGCYLRIEWLDSTKIVWELKSLFLILFPYLFQLLCPLRLWNSLKLKLILIIVNSPPLVQILFKTYILRSYLAIQNKFSLGFPLWICFWKIWGGCIWVMYRTQITLTLLVVFVKKSLNNFFIIPWQLRRLFTLFITPEGLIIEHVDLAISLPLMNFKLRILKPL